MPHGLLLVDKDPEMTSHDVVARVRRILGCREVGHAGTLDPIASGLMVLLIGDGTKLSQYILSQDKAYEVEIRLGVVTDTLDRAGETLKESSAKKVTLEQIQKVIEEAQGDLSLKVPQFSAIKVQGRKLYEKARKGEDFEPPHKDMKFYDIKLKEVKGDQLKVSLRCSKGSYIRSWVSHIGEKLGCGAIVQELHRTESHPYKVEDAISLSELKHALEVSGGDIPMSAKKAYIPLVMALPEWKALTVKGRDEQLLLNGQISHDLFQRLIFEQKAANKTMVPIGIKVISAEKGRLLSLLEARPSKGLKIKRVFHTPPNKTINPQS